MKKQFIFSVAFLTVLAGCKKDKNSDSSTCSFDNANLVKTTITSDVGLSETLVYTYASSGEKSNIYSEAKRFNVNEFDYLGNATSTAKIYNRANGAFIASTVSVANDAGRIVNYIIYRGTDTTEIDRYHFKYDNAGNPTELVNYASYKYNNFSKKYPIDSSLYTWKNGNLDHVLTYVNGNLIIREDFQYKTEKGTGKQYQHSLPIAIESYLTDKYVREVAFTSQDLYSKSIKYNCLSGRCIDSNIIKPVYDISGKLISYEQNHYWLSGGWNRELSQYNLNYECKD